MQLLAFNVFRCFPHHASFYVIVFRFLCFFLVLFPFPASPGSACAGLLYVLIKPRRGVVSIRLFENHAVCPCRPSVRLSVRLSVRPSVRPSVRGLSPPSPLNGSQPNLACRMSTTR